MMNIFETIGLAWVVFSAGLSTITIFYLAFYGWRQMKRERTRGAEEELLDLQRSMSVRRAVETARS